MDGFFWDSFITRREIVYSKLHFTYHTWKVYLSPWNFELRVNLFDSPSLISSTYHWFIDAKRHWKCNAVILMMPYFVEHNAVKIIFFSVKSQISSALTLDSKHKALQLTCKRKFICVSLNVLFSYQITHVRGEMWLNGKTGQILEDSRDLLKPKILKWGILSQLHVCISLAGFN